MGTLSQCFNKGTCFQKSPLVEMMASAKFSSSEISGNYLLVLHGKPLSVCYKMQNFICTEDNQSTNTNSVLTWPHGAFMLNKKENFRNLRIFKGLKKFQDFQNGHEKSFSNSRIFHVKYNCFS